MNDNITPRLDKVLKNAKKEAVTLGSGSVGLEHVVIAIIDTDTKTINEVLTKTGVKLALIREALVRSVTPEEKSTVDEKAILYTRELESCLSAAKNISDRFNHQYVGTEHVLIAILESGSTNANIVLGTLDLDVLGLAKALGEALELATKKNPEPEKVYTGSRGPSDEKSGNETYLKKFAIDLSEKAAKGELDPVIGRKEEVKRLVHILSRKKKNNPVLVGPPGVGKTSIVEGLALRIHEGSAPKPLLQKKVFALDLGLLVAGTVYRGQFEERVKKILKEVKDNPNFIIFIDELHTVIGAGASEGGMDVSNMFKPALARGEFSCVGATTEDEYRRYIQRDAALERRFQLIKVEEPSVKDTISILNGASNSYSKFHGVSYEEGVVEEIVALSNRYITDRFHPDKGFDLLDEAGALVKLAYSGSPEVVKELEEKLSKAQSEYSEAKASLDLEKVSKVHGKIRRLELQIAKAKAKDTLNALVVKKSHVHEIVSSWTSIPVGELSSDDKNKLTKLADDLKGVVIAQDLAVETVAKSVKKYRTPFKDPKKPIGSFLFVGPTGVGKTLLAKSLAKTVFGSEKAMLQLDMAEYSDSTAVNKLIGSSAGYVGYEDGAKLLKHVQRTPYTVILFDEIEKAHQDVIQVLLGIMEDGRLTDNHGKTVDFRNTILIMTSNVGVEEAKAMGFGTASALSERAKENMMVDVRRRFKQEFLGRVDITIFDKMTLENARKVVLLEISMLNKRLEEHKIKIQASDAVVDYILSHGYEEKYGARNIRRQVETQIEDPLTDDFLSGKIVENSVINFDVSNNELQHSVSGAS